MNNSLLTFREKYNTLATLWHKTSSSLFLLSLRIWVAWVFLQSGLNKWSSWDSTIYLFSEEYKVPLLSPELAAYLGTTTELILPVFLILGLGTRVSAGILFIFNIIAVASYPVLTQNGFKLFTLGAMDHQIWGLMLFMLTIFGAGKISLDRLLKIH